MKKEQPVFCRVHTPQKEHFEIVPNCILNYLVNFICDLPNNVKGNAYALAQQQKLFTARSPLDGIMQNWNLIALSTSKKGMRDTFWKQDSKGVLWPWEKT